MKVVRAITVSLLVATSTTTLIAKPSVQIFPSGPTVPENLLRIELRFSTPLRVPLSTEHVKLTDASGVEIKNAFLDLLLPGADGKSVTILLHPGRVKSGVRANLALGRALHAGDTVVLTLTHPAVAKPVRKTWQVTAFDAEPPQPARWTLAAPPPGSRTPLVLHLDMPIGSSAEALIAIRGPNGERVIGKGSLESGETVWRFVPTRTWRAGSYAVVTHPGLEDPAGNRPCAPFEVRAGSAVGDEQGTIRPFEIFATR